jgi:4-hydroxybenzoate polyprenyltransferase
VQIWLPVGLGPSFALAISQHAEASIWQPGLAALIAGTLAVYSGERWADARNPEDRRHDPGLARILLAGTVVGLAVLVALSFWAPVTIGVPTLISGSLALAYPLLRRFGPVKTITVALAWTVATLALPFPAGMTELVPLSLATALLIYGGTVLCDLKDEASDRADGSGSLPALIGSQGARLVAGTTLLLGSAVALSSGATGLGVAGVLTGGLALLPQALKHPTRGPLLVDSCLVLAGPLSLLLP